MKHGSRFGRQGIVRRLRGRGAPVVLLAAAGVLGTASGFALASQPDETGHTPVTICHHAGPNPDNWHTITVDDDAVQAHLDHGDSIGACEGDTTSTTSTDATSTETTTTSTVTEADTTTSTTSHDPVTLCHHAGPDPANWHEITVDDDSVLQAHLAHGDTIGACPDVTTTVTDPDTTTTVTEPDTTTTVTLDETTTTTGPDTTVTTTIPCVETAIRRVISPATVSTVTDPGSTVTQTVPGSTDYVTVPGETSEVTQDGTTSTVTQPGSTITETQPGSTLTSTVPGSTFVSTIPGTTNTVTDCTNETSTITSTGDTSTSTDTGSVLGTVASGGDPGGKGKPAAKKSKNDGGGNGAIAADTQDPAGSLPFTGFQAPILILVGLGMAAAGATLRRTLGSAD